MTSTVMNLLWGIKQFMHFWELWASSPCLRDKVITIFVNKDDIKNDVELRKKCDLRCATNSNESS